MIDLPTGETIADREETGYKYLDILELDIILGRQMKELITEAYDSGLKSS